MPILRRRKTPRELAQSYEPIPVGDRPRFLEAVKGYVPTRPFEWDPVRAILFGYHTGCHPDVIVHPRRSRVRLVDGLIHFSRPKKKGIEARVKPKVPHPDIAPWVGEFIDGLREPTVHTIRTVHYLVDGPNGRKSVERTREQDFCYLRLFTVVQTVTRDIGFPGVTYRTLRHTWANRVKKVTGGNVNAIARELGTNAQNALRYSNDAEADTELSAALEGLD